jgi:hypothetical protein
MGDRPKNPYERRGKTRVAIPVETAEKRPGLRKLPNDLVELADGRSERLTRPRRPPPDMEDERIGFVIAGVRNQDARAVYDARVTRLRKAAADGDEAALAKGLCDAVRLTIWRARNVTEFQAFAESVVGVSPERAQTLARAGAEQQGVSLEMLPAHVVALWLRLEAALLRSSPDASVGVSGVRDTLALELHVPAREIARAVEGFFDMGEAASGLRRFLRADAPSAATAQRPERGRPPARFGRDADRGPRRDDGREPERSPRRTDGREPPARRPRAPRER